MSTASWEEHEATLREKARWYLEHGVETVWLVMPDAREVLVVTPRGHKRVASGRVPAPASMPDCAPQLAELFR